MNRNFIKIMLLIIILSVVSFTNIPSIQPKTLKNEIENGSYSSHIPIKIDNDEELTLENGVIKGNGTFNDPFVMEGWEIDGKGYDYCIYIGNTTSYLIIKNCKLYGTINHKDIYLRNSNNNIITNNDVYGISIRSSNNNHISNNTCGGISISDSSYYNIIADNIIRTISLWSSNYNIIRRNECSNNNKNDRGGTHGIILQNSSNNLVANNICENFEVNIDLYSPTNNNNTIIENTLINGDYGILQKSGNYNIIKKNICSNNEKVGMTILGINNILDGNECKNNRIYGIGISGDNNIIENNKCNNNDVGLHVGGKNTIIKNNICSHNQKFGLLLHDSNNSKITLNTFKSNRDYGMRINEDCSGNSIHHNDFISNGDNQAQAYDSGKNNNWNDTNGEGNYWDEYWHKNFFTGSNGKVWDEPYKIDGPSGAKDYYPLVKNNEDMYRLLLIAGLIVFVIYIIVIIFKIRKRRKLLKGKEKSKDSDKINIKEVKASVRAGRGRPAKERKVRGGRR